MTRASKLRRVTVRCNLVIFHAGNFVVEGGVMKYLITLSILTRFLSNFKKMLQTESSFIYIKMELLP